MTKPWTERMPDEQFERMRSILAAPSPVGLEASMTYGVVKPMFDSFSLDDWGIHSFRGNAAIVLDTDPGATDKLTVMLVGHADKIRLQVRSIGDDGKIWINSDSFLPQVLVGHEVTLFTEDTEAPGQFRTIEGGTIEALGAIHFASPKVRSGESGIRRKQLYLELQLHGERRKAQVEALGIRAGDPLILKRPIKRGFAPDAFYGAYLDNGLGCFVVEEVARLIAGRGGLDNVRVLFALASHEEIGRMGSRVLARTLEPDVLIAVDVNHDYAAAPTIGDQRKPPLTMGKGFTIDIGSITSAFLNAQLESVAIREEIPYMRNVAGRDTGTDAMAANFTGTDAASASVGFPIRNMHTISETGHTGDVLAAIHVLDGLLSTFDAANDGAGLTAQDLRDSHPRLDRATSLEHQG